MRAGHQDSSQETVISLLGMLVSVALGFINLSPVVTRSPIASLREGREKQLDFVRLWPNTFDGTAWCGVRNNVDS